jgi:integral membrane protein
MPSKIHKKRRSLFIYDPIYGWPGVAGALPNLRAIDIGAPAAPLSPVMSAPDLRDPVGRVCFVGMLEGVSFVVLLACSAIKRLADMPTIVFVPGVIHAALFLLFLLVIFLAWGSKALTTKQSALAFISSVIPFGPFFIDRFLEKGATQSGDSAD